MKKVISVCLAFVAVAAIFVIRAAQVHAQE